MGVHYSRRFIFKAIARVPVVLVVWFLALAIPFFGPINSVMGAFLIAFSVYIIPCVAFVKAYRNKELLEVCCLLENFVISILSILFLPISGFGIEIFCSFD